MSHQPPDIVSPDSWIGVTKTCPLCHTQETNVVPYKGYLKWKNGMLIQHAMPEVNECIREFLLTGFCEDCRAENDRVNQEMEDS